MKKLFSFGALLFGLLSGQYAGAQGTVQNDDLVISISTDSSSYAGYNSTGALLVNVWHTSQSVTIDSGAVEVAVMLPIGLELDTTSMSWLPAGWDFIYDDSYDCRLVNTASLAPFPIWTGQQFDIPFKITGAVNNQPASAQITFQGLIGLGYNEEDDASNFTNITIQVANVSLPVDFASFDAKAAGCAVALNWVTSREENNDYFVVERSQDGRYFAKVGSVKALSGEDVGNREYSFVDEHPFQGNNFYRIRQMDINGKSTTTSVEKVQLSCDFNGDIAIYPNPTRGIVYVKGLADAESIEVFNVLGQRVLTQKIKQGTEVLDISNLADGNYHLRVIRNQESIFSAKIVKK